MKKQLLILGMITCIFGLTGCGTKEVEEPLITEENAIESGENLVGLVVQLYQEDSLAQLEGMEGYEIFEEAVASYEKAAEDIGSYVGIISSESEADVDADSAVINITVEGTEHNAIVEVIAGKNGVESITTNVVYTFGESMEKAALNTLLGMGTVFVVLILICFIISGFKIFAVLENRKKKKEEKAEAPKAASVPAPAPAAAPVQEENLTDDLELVAVIAAAIAASEGAATTDGFVVRSIRKANKNKWQNALN